MVIAFRRELLKNQSGLSFFSSGYTVVMTAGSWVHKMGSAPTNLLPGRFSKVFK